MRACGFYSRYLRDRVPCIEPGIPLSRRLRVDASPYPKTLMTCITYQVGRGVPAEPRQYKVLPGTCITFGPVCDPLGD